MLAFAGVRSVRPVAPALQERSGGFARGRASTPIRTGPRARERRLQARLAQQPPPSVSTVAACARRAFRGTRVVARRNAPSRLSSSTTPFGPARPFRLARVPRTGMTNTYVRLGTHPGDRTRRGERPQSVENLAGDRRRSRLRPGREIPTLPQPSSSMTGRRAGRPAGASCASRRGVVRPLPRTPSRGSPPRFADSLMSVENVS